MPSRPRPRPLAAALTALLLASASAWAQVSVLQVPNEREFLTRHWTSAEGLPQNSVFDIATTSDGFLWAATLGGLCRFDGTAIRVFHQSNTPALRSNRILALHTAADGSLWIATQHDGIARYFDHGFEFVCATEGEIRSLATDRHGKLHAITDHGLFRLVDHQLVREQQDALPAPRRLFLRRNGDLLVANDDRLFVLGDHGARAIANGIATDLAETTDGTLWAVSPDGLHRLDGDRLAPWQPIPQLARPSHRILAASDDSLWISNDQQILHLRHDWLAKPTTHIGAAPVPVVNNVVMGLGEDLNGRIWLGSVHDGLWQLRPSEMVGFGPASGLLSYGANAILSDGKDGMYVSTGRGLYHCTEGRFELLQPAPKPGKLGIDGMYRDQDGTLWFGTPLGLGRMRPDGTRMWRREDGIPEGCLRAIHRDHHGDLWVGSMDGVRVLRGEQVEDPAILTPLRSEMIDVLVDGPDGALWIGGARHLARLSPDRQSLRLWRVGVDIPKGEVRAILPRDGEQAWVATYGGGFCRVDGDQPPALVDRSHGLYDESICSVVAWRDRLVIGANRGSFTVAKTAFDDIANGLRATIDCRPIAGPEGMSAECSGGIQPGAVLTGDTVWICSIDGLFRLDPDDLEPHADDVPCHVEEILSGETRLLVSPTIAAPLGERVVSFQLTACSFDHPAEVRFSWRLRGRDDAWSTPSHARQASFSQLRPGDYTFEAFAIDVDGVRSKQPATIALHVPPLWWETTPARSFAVLLALLLSLFLHRFGAARSAARAARLQRLVDDRTADLRAAQTHLEERVASRTAELHESLQRQETESSERARLEREVAQLQRMESLGLLAGGVAHDFNNLLTVVLGCGSMLEQELLNNPALAELAANIRAAGERGRRLTQHLLAVASRQVVQPGCFDLGTVLADLEPVLRTLLGDSIVLQLQRAERPLPVRAAITQIEQILLNLAANARDAMPRGGRVDIELGEAADRPGHVRLCVRDDGPGMSPAVRERAFEPFFTTRARSSNSGLGLSTVYGICKQLGGDVSVTSELGHGSVFTIHLPLLAASESVGPVVALPHTTAGEIDIRVLLIEDDEAVRAVLQRMLTRLGCRVQQASHGQEAVALLAAGPSQFDAVLSDVVMPGLQGIDLVRALRSVRQDLPIVFLSGYPDGNSTFQDLVDAGLEVLSKPPVAAQLALAIERACRAMAPRGLTASPPADPTLAAKPAP